jgi:hypothetical protein
MYKNLPKLFSSLILQTDNNWTSLNADSFFSPGLIYLVQIGSTCNTFQMWKGGQLLTNKKSMESRKWHFLLSEIFISTILQIRQEWENVKWKLSGNFFVCWTVNYRQCKHAPLTSYGSLVHEYWICISAAPKLIPLRNWYLDDTCLDNFKIFNNMAAKPEIN